MSRYTQSQYAGYARGSMPAPNPPLYGQMAYQPPQPTYPTSTTPSYPGQSSHSTYTTPSSTTIATTSSEMDASMNKLIVNITSLVQNATNEELDGFIGNDDKINQLIQDSEITKELKRKREEMTTFNKDQAVTNLSLKPELDILKAKLSELSTRQNELRDRYLTCQQKLGSSLAPDTILAILQAAMVEKETSSDNIKNQFYDGEINVDEFMKQFMEERKFYTLRKIKSDKLKVILQSRQMGLGYQTTQPPYPINQPPQFPQQHIPRPRTTPHPPPPAGYYGYGAR